MVTTLRVEGWCTDPFGRHEARWLSDGTPTKLVRDAQVESYDPPSGTPEFVAEPIGWGEQTPFGADLLRSDVATPSSQALFDHLAAVVLGGCSD